MDKVHSKKVTARVWGDLDMNIKYLKIMLQVSEVFKSENIIIVGGKTKKKQKIRIPTLK